MDQHESIPGAGTGGSTGAGRDPVPSLSVYLAEPVLRNAPLSPPDLKETRAGADGNPAHPDGFSGSLALQGVEALDQDEAGAVLARLDHLVRWAQAQQAKVLHRVEGIFRTDFLQQTKTLDPGLTFSLAAEEAAAILHLPTGTAKMMMSDAGSLCSTHTATLRALEAGMISYGHAQNMVDQSQNIPAGDVSGFEAELLTGAGEQTQSQFRVKARRLRENLYPETIPVRHKSAFESRRVCLAPDTDGMSWLSAYLSAEKAQAIYTQLSTAARGEQAAGDPRPVDQLRADILGDLLGGGATDGGGVWAGPDENTEPDVHPVPDVHTGSDENAGPENSAAAAVSAEKSNTGTGKHGRNTTRTDILVLITAETLFGADDQPAELHGYGPLSPETARRLARQATRWTPVERDPDTGEILKVGRRRKVPAGLKRWLRARDATCRFPGCRTNAVIADIDHTKPWSSGGSTDHDNLEHLCRRHHLFKTAGFWKARQPTPGVIHWTSPGGRTYRTEPHLTLAPLRGASPEPAKPPSFRGIPAETDQDGYGSDPPPF